MKLIKKSFLTPEYKISILVECFKVKNRIHWSSCTIVPEGVSLSFTGTITDRKEGLPCYNDVPFVDVVGGILGDGAEISHILQLWKDWNANGEKIGTKRQEQYLLSLGGNFAHEAAVSRLKQAGLYSDDKIKSGAYRGYVYGTEKLFKPVPAKIIEIIKNL